MFWKKDNSFEKKFIQINEIVKKSFANVKRDTANIFQWLNYLYRKSLEQDQALKRVQSDISNLPKSRDEIKRIVDGYYSIDIIMARIKELSIRIDELSRIKQTESHIPEQAPRELHIDLSHIEKRLERLEQRKISIKEKMIKKLTRNSKEYIKGVILSYIKKYEKISALQLKGILVEEQSFCSKSTFYRLLEELEELDDIGVVKQGKEKHYISKAVKHI